MLSAPTRRVRHLELRAPSAAHARRGAVLVEDALRTASLPDADQGRLIVVRRLDLGPIDPAAPAARVALRIEDAFRRLQYTAVAFDTPVAPLAGAVYFADSTAAIVQLTRRFARRQPTTDWFWRSALPGWEPLRDRTANWLWLAERALEHPAAPPAFVAEALAAGVLDELFAAIPLPHAETWIRRAGWSPATSTTAARPVPLPTAATTWLVRRLAADPEVDARIHWLGTVLALAHRPTLAADPALPARVLATLALLTPPANAVAFSKVSPPASPRQPAAAPSPISRGRQLEGALTPHTTGEALTAPRSPAETAPLNRSDSPPPPATQRPPSFGPETDSLTTDCAGLLFLLPLLHRLGFERRLAREPALLDAAFPARLLLHVGHRVGLTARDPLAHALLALCPEEPTTNLPFTPWYAALRHACRRTTGIHLRSLIHRPAQLRTSPTHLDFTFDPTHADVRLRRAGLDLDPGWVPWLGLVIRYHYSNAS